MKCFIYNKGLNLFWLINIMQGKGGSFIEICYRYLSAQKRVASEQKISLNEQLDQPAGKLFQALEELVSFARNYLGQSLCSFYFTRWQCLWQISIFVAWIALEIGNCRVNRKEKMTFSLILPTGFRKSIIFHALLQLIDHTTYLSSESKFSLFCLNFTTAGNYSEELFFVR